MAGKNVVRMLKGTVNHIWAMVDFEGPYEDDGDRKTDIVDLGRQSPSSANGISSQIHPDSFTDWRKGSAIQWHKPLIDIDIPIAAVPSTTEGHFHLFIDKELTWEEYKTLLKVLRDLKIIEDGYYQASLRRGATWVRAPWCKKPPEEIIEEEEVKF
ncbi:hypothetical protein SEA_PARVUSTARDA_73 [Gordonia phage ParvusTarda]|uniref:Uncharacterized protein n=1 Tax=Gordonia phage ParvusTarda TaxID=2927261 RepID=A0A9E7U3R1_9CAUD|nr:hypothetical protein SEA_PARVUSTARDA_73 [Gordonia phage ParvusTarda]